MQKKANKRLVDENRLGELLVAAKMLERTSLAKAFQTVEATGLRLGQVLILGDFVSENVLRAAFLCRAKMKTAEMDLDTAKKTLKAVSTGKYQTPDHGRDQVTDEFWES